MEKQDAHLHGHNGFIMRSLHGFSAHLATWFKALRHNRFALIVIIILFLFYWGMDQGMDLLTILNHTVDSDYVDTDIHVILFFVSLSLIAFICWFFPRILFKDNLLAIKHWKEFWSSGYDLHYEAPAPGDTHAYLDFHYRKMTPRLMGLYIILIPTFGLLNVEQIYEVGYGEKKAGTILICVIAASLALYSMKLYHWLRKNLGPLLKNGWVQLGLVIASGILLGIFEARNQGQKGDLIDLFYVGLICAFLYFFLANTRKYVAANLFGVKRYLKKVTAQQSSGSGSSIMFKLLFILGLVSLIYFIVINAYIPLAEELNPLICVHLGLISYLWFFYILSIIGKRKGVQYATFLIALLAVVGVIRKNGSVFDARYVEPTMDPSDRILLNEYVHQWFTDRETEIMASDKFPLIVVAAQGGGSRAAYWTLLMHDYLGKDNPDYYNKHLFALCGASGGTTGNSMYQTMMADNVSLDSIGAIGREVFAGNFVSSSMTLVLGRDMIRGILGWPSGNGDRAEVLELEWAHRYKVTMGLPEEHLTWMDRPFLDPYYDENGNWLNRPIQIINTTKVQTGGHYVTSPVSYAPDQFPACPDMLQELYDLQNQSIRLSTATLLNARFPYIVPIGKMDSLGQFGDAGYYDNYGATTAYNLLRIIKEYMATHPELESKVELYCLIPINSFQPEAADELKHNTQALAPLITLANVRGAQTRRAAAAVDVLIGEDHVLELDINEENLKNVIIPLGRYLSQTALGNMDTVFTETIVPQLEPLKNKMTN